MLIGYARVSKTEQNLDRQIDCLTKYGVDRRNIYSEKVTGRKYKREALNKMISELQEGDIVVVSDLTRIARSSRDMFLILDRIIEKKASIKSIKDTWLDTSSENPYNAFLLTVMSALSQLERDLIAQRTREGLASARARGVKGGRPNKRNDKADVVIMLRNNNYTIDDISKKCEISRSTIYRILNDDKEKNK